MPQDPFDINATPPKKPQDETSPRPSSSGLSHDPFEIQAQETPGEKAGKKPMGRILLENAPGIAAGAATALAGPEAGWATRVGLGMLGSVPGTIAKQQGEQRIYGAPGMTGEESAADIAKEAATQGLWQGATEAFSGALNSVIGKFAKKKIVPTVVPASSAPTPATPVPSPAKYQQASLESLAARTESADAEAAKKAMQSVYEASQEALAPGPLPGEYGIGQEVQSNLERTSKIFHKHGDAKYDLARQLTYDKPAPADAIIKEAGDLLAERGSAQVAATSQPNEALPKTIDYPKPVKDILTELNRLPEKPRVEVLDLYRRKLGALLQDADPLVKNEAQGLYSKFTRLIAESMEAAAKGDPAASAAAKEARLYWKEGMDIFDHSVLSKAVRSNPEDVVNMIHPGTSTRSPGVSEAVKLRQALWDHTAKYGTPQEIAENKPIYSRFVSKFIERNLLGQGLDKLPGQLKAYGKDAIDTLFNIKEIPELGVAKTNLQDLSASVEAAKIKAGLAETAEKAAQTARREFLASTKRFGVESASAKTKAEKLVQDQIDLREKIIADRTKRVEQNVRAGLRLGLSALGFETGGISGAAAGGVAALTAESLLPYILRSKLGTRYLTRGVEEIVAKSAPKSGALLIRPEVPNYVPPVWVGNLSRAFKLGKDLMDSEAPSTSGPPSLGQTLGLTPATPIPTR